MLSVVGSYRTNVSKFRRFPELINANASMVVGNWVDYISHMLSKGSTFGPMSTIDLKGDFLHPKVLPLYQVVSRG